LRTAKAFFLESILLLGDFYLKTSFIKKLRVWRRILAKSESELERIQVQKLNALLSFATQNAPFYQVHKVKPGEDPMVWLKSFPVLKKSDFRANLPSIVTRPIASDLAEVMSSGSTGPPSKVYFSKDEISSNRALQVIWWEWAGYRFGDSILQTGVNMKRSREKAVKDKLLNTRYIDALSHSEEQILEELRLTLREPRDLFIGYASSLYLFAKIALENGITDIKFKSIISLGEKLLPQFREVIEKAFQCIVYDTYGASEGFLIASQCMNGSYHLMSPHIVVELLDDEGKEVEEGQLGRVVITGLDNFTTPMIRYEVGDLAIKSKSKNCSCGLKLPMLEEVVGRITEFLITPQGKFITVQTVVRILKQFNEIEQFKLIQTGKEEYRLIYISSKNQEEVRENEIQSMFETVFKESLQLSFEKVKTLPKAKTGKFQLIENLYKSV
jgi:phenylacetate-CoA ligase